MEESGEPHTEASADRGSWMKRRLREQRAQQKDSQHVHNIADERASKGTRHSSSLCAHSVSHAPENRATKQEQFVVNTAYAM